MNISEFRNWCEEINALLLTCEESHDLSDHDAGAVVRQLYGVLLRAPEVVKEYFDTQPEASAFESLFEHGAFETILFEITRNVGWMISRSPSGRAIVTIGIPDLDIECSFSSESSLPVAMTGAIATAALEVFESGPDPVTIN